MITGVAFCPQAPALVPAVGRGLDAELGPVRDACREAIRRVATPETQIVIIGAGERNASFGPTSRGSFTGFGVDLVIPLGSDEDGPTELPPSLAVGAWLVRDALGPDTGATGYAVDAEGDLPSTDGPDPFALIVIGDGSACRTEKAPGYLRPGAAEFDAGVAAALAGGEGYRLHRGLLDDNYDVVLDRNEDDDVLMSVGVHVWNEMSWVLETQKWDAELLYDDAPFGVGYFVAAWSARPLTPEQRVDAEHMAEVLARWRRDPEFRKTHRIRLSG